MNKALCYKMFRESRVNVALFSLALFIFETILAVVLPEFGKQLAGPIMEIPFIRNILGALLGIDISEGLSVTTLLAFAWVHPVVLAVVWAQEIVFCVRFPAGEVDRGTIDTLLALPVSRLEAFITHTFGWLCSGLVLLGSGLIGHLAGTWFMGLSPTPGLMPILANFFCLYLSVGCLALFVSALSNRSGRAMGLIFGLILGSFFLSFIVQLWAPARFLSFLSLLEYYRPMVVVRSPHWPLGDMAVLCTIAILFWSAAAVFFNRRDICAT